MQIVNKIIEIETKPGINIHNITPQIQDFLIETRIKNGQVVVFNKHTTTALAINEDEERLLVDIQNHFAKFAPADAQYLHNDLHLREVPPDEPENAHSHLIALSLNNSELVPIVEGKLALGNYQSVLFLELDGARKRWVLLQITGI